MSELRKPTKQTTCVTQSVCDLSPELTPFGISVEKYSSFIKLIRITAWMLRFVESLKGKRSDNSFLTSVELKHAEKMWILYVKRKHFLDMYSAISEKWKHNLQQQLGIFVDKDGLLRCQG